VNPWRPLAVSSLACLAMLGLADSKPASAVDPTVLPHGTILGEDPVVAPREVLHDEAAGGRQSDLVALGNLAFASPQILGDPARKAGISCETCHSNGDINRALFIPGLSDRPGGLAVVNPLFNARTDNGLHRPVDIPSLRGVRFLAPYGRDGRIASLRDFTRNVIVNEFAGREPSPRLVDAIVAYMEQIDFLANPKLGPSGRLRGPLEAAARRGEALFNRPFAQMGGQSCAGCHRPDALFTDRELHDVGSGGAFKTPTLLNADFSAPYFHDGRFAGFAQVVDYFNGEYGLGLAADEKSDLVAYLNAVGDGERAFEPVTADTDLDELLVFLSPLDLALAERDLDTISLVVDATAHELRELRERYPGPKDPFGAADIARLRPARVAAAQLAMALRRVETLAEDNRFEEAKAALAAFRAGAETARPVFRAAAAVSLYEPDRQARHQAPIASVTGP
jgi:cytochrome c peroxidase